MKRAAYPRESEHSHQVALFHWAAYHQDPRVKLMFAIANGGHRHIAVARKLKAEGVKAGVPDIFLPVSVGHGAIRAESMDYQIKNGFGVMPVVRNYHGLFVEMKFGKNKPTPSQLWWHERLEEQGYKVAVCYTWVEAKEVIEEYLGIGKGRES